MHESNTFYAILSPLLTQVAGGLKRVASEAGHGADAVHHAFHTSEAEKKEAGRSEQ